MTARVDGALVAALQATLAGEHAAVWACGRAAAELTGGARDAALSELDDHRLQRDGLRRRLADLGVAPVEAAAAYVEPLAVTGRRTARRLLAHVGNGLCAAYADLAAASPPGGRQAAVTAAVRSARRADAWGSGPQPFPGSGAADPLGSEGDQS
jgi:hypothetical protein